MYEILKNICKRKDTIIIRYKFFAYLDICSFKVEKIELIKNMNELELLDFITRDVNFSSVSK